MSRGPRDKFEHPALAPALAWLRTRVRLTQEQVAERAQDRGDSLSAVYYRFCEQGKRSPSSSMLDTMLTALGSDRQELEGLLEHKPWNYATSDDSYRLRRETPKAFLATPECRASMAADFSSLRPQSVNSVHSDVLGSVSHTETPSQVYGELSELTNIFVNLPRSDQLSLLGHARSRRKS